MTCVIFDIVSVLALYSESPSANQNTCISSRAFPEPVTSWIKNGEELDPSSSKRIRQTDTGNLVIRDVEKSDAGEYFCQVNIN